MSNAIRLSLAAAAVCAFAHTALADAPDAPSAEQVKKGSAIYSQNCSPCHGPRMLDAQGAFDLRNFPKGEKNRFLTSVSKGKNQMPPWGSMLSTDDMESLWAYVLAGEK